MILSVSEQALLFLSACAAGFVIGFVYDIFRVVRIALPHPSFLIQLEDLLYWALAFISMFMFLHRTTGGEVRAYSLLGAALGALVYFLSLSAVVMAIFSAIISFVKKLVTTTITILLIPIGLLLHILSIPYLAVLKKLRLAKKHFKKLLQNSLICVRIKKRKITRDLTIIIKKR